SPLRAGVLVPTVLAIGLVGGYAGATLLWPLHAVAPDVRPAAVEPLTAADTTPRWPDSGSAAVGVAGFAPVASSTEQMPMASITKVITALMVLEQRPLQPGEQGRGFAFTFQDRAAYWNYLARHESALDVPVGGSLSLYQLLQGMLIGSAGNYTDRLVSSLWGSDEAFARAATRWLERKGIAGITVVEPTGIDPGNTAAPAALAALADLALADPVVAEIVRTESVVLPGAGTITNTNDLLADDGTIAGVKTGSLWGRYNLLGAKDVSVAGVTLHAYAAVLGQPSDRLRDEETARLLDAVSAQVVAAELPAGTLAGRVTTEWGATVDAVTAQTATAVLWNGATTSSEVARDLGRARTAGAEVGALTLTDPVTTSEVPVVLSADIPAPSAWWRLTHPLQLFGLAD
ncbi:hypothetical protein, partial [Mycobacterium sp.]|uniref:hypothetical protein n=1 Tax=Mycobacterium sp. TaxID=1785 RepID=UPI003A8C4DF0